ncbi:NAD(P)-dependent dehydrogenase (short-subunit alcohol dehydrogenase family) [Agromyces flavus]|uniref:NAD(P)-dependent dehydrogenase (Short-subunit alcohol dehydrogenase family) n=1 Tax=Agromyces flavus TaxID=589382 RepID=A0A1H1NXR2_9MICO|nr:SDR family oxidoreductase [Agromyces flavus]MCP2368023.1 NAD(P)-dependent dehydrogenase (short-subunit alcohol dehydrogenase family) [Agromyces flavus]GGI47485.1 dehydrogenase [Agromyces flavus]SDS03771.1 NAD(P)-dependent dehydrogenase, short-chain alcohol dehydrogenase family [Agromyces flavus]
MTGPDDDPRSPLDPARLFSCHGQVAIVTGGSSGIGRAAAEALAAAGARVLIAGLPESDPESVGAALRERGLEVVGLETDLAAPGSAQVVVDAAVDRWGRLDTVVANAGAALDAHGPIDLDALDRMYALHVRSIAELANAAVPVIADGGGGAFLVMSSLAGLRGNRVLSGYGITKAANAQLVRNLAVQWGHAGVRANAISPGVIATDFARPITEDPGVATERRERTPLGRFGRVDEVAGAVVWLASSAGAFVTGQNIVIDGGTLVAD